MQYYSQKNQSTCRAAAGSVPKRFLSFLLTIFITFTLLPSMAVPVMADSGDAAGSGVIYNRVQPELAIMNIQNSDQMGALYKKIKDVAALDKKPAAGSADAAYVNYNLMDQNVLKFRKGTDGKYAYTNSTKTYKGVWDAIWPDPNGSNNNNNGYEKSVIYKIANSYEYGSNLDYAISATFNNVMHTHVRGSYLPFIFLKDIFVARTCFDVCIGMRCASAIGSIDIKDTTITKKDESGYCSIPSRRYDPASTTSRFAINLEVARRFGSGTDGICTCNLSSIGDALICFRDMRSPDSSLFFKAGDGGWLPALDRFSGKLKAGDKLELKLIFNEPIRFADDDPAGKEQLYLGLREQGKTEITKKAYLTKLEEDSLYFEYTVPSEGAEDTIITGVDYSSLKNENQKLVHVVKDKNFEIASDTLSGDGIDKVSTVITDIAGNPVRYDESAPLNIAYDTVEPQIQSVSSKVNANNAELKAFLGKDPLNASGAEGDNSDIYLSAGDSISFEIAFEETLKAQLSPGVYDVRLKTNLYTGDPDNPNYIIIDPPTHQPMQLRDAMGSNGAEYSVIYTPALTITSDMKCDDSQGRILVTELLYNDGNIDKLVDKGGNELLKSYDITVGQNSNPKFLDSAAPSFDGVPEAAAYTPSAGAKTDTWFSFPFTILDEGGSGYVGAPIIMTLSNDKSPNYEYKYIVNSGVTEPSDWSAAPSVKQGETVSFAAIAGNNMFLHVKTGSKGDGILGGFVLDLTAQDYAGNKTSRSWAINWGKDNEKPNAAAGAVSRSGEPGSISVAIDLSDNYALRRASYQWTDTEEVPSDWSSATPILEVAESDDPKMNATGAAVAAVDNGANFSKYLWVKTVDAQDNDSVQNLGQFSYNRSRPNVIFAYNQHPALRPELKLTELGGDNAAFVYFEHEGQLWGRFVKGVSDNLFEEMIVPALGSASGSWNNYSLSSSGGIYTFTALSGNADAPPFVTNRAIYNYTGVVNLHILTGDVGAFSGKTEGQLLKDDTIVAGNSTYQVFHESVALAVIAEDLEDSSAFNLAYQPTVSFSGIVSQNKTVSTVGGVSFTVTLPAENTLKPGCDYNMIDWTKAEVLISQGGVSLGIPIQKLVSQAEAKTQIVTVPMEASLAEGEYTVILSLPFKAAVVPKNTIPTWVTGDINKLTMLIDATEPNENFSMESVTYSPAGLDGLYHDFHEVSNDKSFPSPSAVGFTETAVDQNILGYQVSAGDTWSRLSIIKSIEGGTTYLPTASSESYARNNVGVYNNPHGTYTLNFKIGNLVRDGKYGKATVVVNNMVQGLEDISVSKAANGADANIDARVFATAAEAKGFCESNPNVLPLIAGQDNLIAMKLVYDNGKETAVKSVVLNPKPVMTWNESGANYDEAGTGKYFDLSATGNNTDSAYLNQYLVTASGGALCLSPSAAYADKFSDLTLYAVNNNAAEKEQKAFTLHSDGKYYVDLDEGLGFYTIFGIDAYGGLTVFTDLRVKKSQETDYSANAKAKYAFSAIVDTAAPCITGVGNAESTDGGIFSTSFTVTDSSIIINKASKLHISIALGEDYAATIAAANAALDLDVNISGDMYTQGEVVLWTLPEYEIAPHGIYKVTMKYNAGRAIFTVYGVPGSENEKPVLIFSAEDVYGNRASAAPHMIDITATDIALSLDIADIKVADVIPQTPVVKVNSNAPIMPANSWCIGTAASYSTEHAAQFPLTKNGEAEISYYDVFGFIHTQKVNVTQFGDFTGSDTCGSKPYTRGLDISISETEPTAGTVIINAKSVDPNLFVYISSVELRNGDCYGDCQQGSMSLEVEQNGVYYVYLVEKDQYNAANGYPGYVSQIRQAVPVHVRNILSGTPAAEPRFYLEATGSDYSAAEIAEMKAANGGVNINSNGFVRVSYVSDRDLVPAYDTDLQHTFNYGGSDSYTFLFADAFGSKGELAVKLSDYGISLTAGSAETIDDEEAPSMSVDIVMKRGDAVSVANSFTNENTAAEIEDAFKPDILGYAQAVTLRVNVFDESDYKLVIRSSAGETLSHSNAVSSNIEGVALTGNQISVQSGASGRFTVYAVDKAGNSSSFTIDAAWITSRLDNLAPEAQTAIVPDGLYNKIGYVRATDANDVILVSPLLEPSDNESYSSTAGWYVYPFTNGNTAYPYTFRDEAGNRVTGSLNVVGINTNKPQLRVRWMTKGGMPAPSAPTNRNVIAFITSDMELQSLSMTYGAVSKLFSAAAATYDDEETGLSVRFESGGAEIVMMKSCDYSLSFAGIGKNGQASDECTVELPMGIIDKEAPKLHYYAAAVTRTAIDVSYALYASEPVYCLEYGDTESNGSPKLYDGSHPLVCTFTENGEYTIRITDLAGNSSSNIIMYEDAAETASSSSIKLSVTGLDKTPPVMTVSGIESLSSYTTGTIEVTVETNENCTISCIGASVHKTDERNVTVSFSENNIYTIIARDAAGNESYQFVKVGNIDKTAPIIIFDSSLVVIRQDSAESALAALLEDGYTTSDNVKDPGNIVVVAYDDSQVDLSKPGVYSVTYTATDSALNSSNAIRHVRVVDKNQPSITLMDGIKPIVTQANGTSVVNANVNYKLLIEGLKLLSGEEDKEPYQLKICKGIYSLGQMKIAKPGLSPDANNQIRFSASGYYTVLITTQSRQTYLTLLYVQN